MLPVASGKSAARTETGVQTPRPRLITRGPERGNALITENIAGDIVALAGMAEPYAGLSHLLGAVVFVLMAVTTLRRREAGLPRNTPVLVFAASCILLLAVSGVYHLLDPATALRSWLRRVDHAAIFLLIGGTWTPVAAFLLDGERCRRVLVLVWVAALVGMLAKLVWFESISYSAGVGLYMMLGWAGLGIGVELWKVHGYRRLRLLIAGGLVYTAGSLSELWWGPVIVPGVIGAHELFHTAVLAGAGLHWAFVFQLLGEADVEHVARRQPVAAATVLQRLGGRGMNPETLSM